jgi:hypothetical protein
MNSMEQFRFLETIGNDNPFLFDESVRTRENEISGKINRNKAKEADNEFKINNPLPR